MAEDSIEQLIAEITGTAQAIFEKCEDYETNPTFTRKKMGATLRVSSAQGTCILDTEVGLPKPADLKLSTGKKTVTYITGVTNQPDLNVGRVQGAHAQTITLNNAVEGTGKSTDIALSWTVNGKAGESVKTKSSGDGKGERLLAKASTTGVSASYTTVSGTCSGISAGVTGVAYSFDLASLNFTLARVLTRGVDDSLTVTATEAGTAKQEVKGVEDGAGDVQSEDKLSEARVGGSGDNG